MRALIAALCLLALAEPVFACSCIEPTPDRQIVPADGATGFPTDGRIRLFFQAFPAGLRARMATEYRLRGPDGLVPMTASVVATRVDLAAALKPDTAYTLEQVFAYDAQGVRLTDGQRLRALRAGPPPTRIWYPVSTFTTGHATAAAPAARARVDRVDVSYRHGGGDCGPGTGLYARWPDVDLGPFDVLELEVGGHGVVATAPRGRPSEAGHSALGVSDLLCDPDPYSLGKGHQRARVLVVGPGPARTKPGAWVDGPAATSSLFGRKARPRTPPDPAFFDPWFTPPATEPAAAAAVGPAGCPHGLERQWAAVGDAAWGPTDYSAWIAVGPAGDGARLVTQTGELAQVVRVDAASRATTPLAAGVEAAAFAGDAGAVLLRTGHDQDVKLSVGRIDADGKAIWTTPLTTEHLNWRGHVALCGDRVAVAYSQVIGQAFGDARLHWALLDAADGRVIRRTTAEDAPVQGFGEGTGLGCHGEGFLLIHALSRGATAWRIDATGIATPTPAPDGSTWSIARDGAGSAVASSTPAGVRVAFLDAAGAETSAVLVAGGHTNRKPTIAAASGDLFGVAWETWPGDAAYATVIDRAGHVAEPLRLGDGARRRTAGIGARPGGFLAVAASLPGVEVEALACAPTARPGPPARLAPP